VRNELKVLRGCRGLSQGQVAIAVGVSRHTIYAVENDRWDPSLSLAFALARFFHRSIEEVFHDDAVRPGAVARPCA
jgi:putative transcriptional regulator